MLAAFTGMLTLGGCVSPRDSPGAAALAADRTLLLFDVATVLDDGWQQQVLNGRTEYRIVALDGRAVVAATARNSASGLIRKVEADVSRCTELTWVWRVDEVQESADLRVKRGDDVAASLFLLFGDPGFLFDPVAVPTLRYAWTGAGHRAGDVIDSPYLPGSVKTIVVRSGTAHTHRWLIEQRDLLADYRLAFGADPEDGVFAVAIYTDNDQTGQPARAYYERITLECRG